MNEKKNGKRSFKYWCKQVKKMKKGDITFKQLALEAETYMEKVLGLVKDPILGWVKPEEVEKAGIDKGKVPVVTEASQKGKIVKVHPKFLMYQEQKIKEEYASRMRVEDMSEKAKLAAETFGDIGIEKDF